MSDELRITVISERPQIVRYELAGWDLSITTNGECHLCEAWPVTTIFTGTADVCDSCLRKAVLDWKGETYEPHEQ